MCVEINVIVCCANNDVLYQIRLNQNDKKTAENAKSAEEEKERISLNNSDTNGNYIVDDLSDIPITNIFSNE